MLSTISTYLTDFNVVYVSKILSASRLTSTALYNSATIKFVFAVHSRHQRGIQDHKECFWKILYNTLPY